jgi:hypothetical protein
MRSALTISIRTSGNALRFALAGAIALALGAASARADCSAAAAELAAGSGERFACTRNCVGDFSRFTFLRTTSLRGDRATPGFCMEQCAATAGCTAVTYEVGVVAQSDGTLVPIVHCNLFRSGPSSTYDYFDKRPGRQNGFCTRIMPPLDLHNDPRFQAETNRFRPDTARPTVPTQVGVPGGFNRK